MRYVCRSGDRLRRVCLDIRAIHVFVERAFIGEGDAGGWNSAPQGGRSVDHRSGLLIRDETRKRSLIDEIVDLPAGPVDWLAKDSGIEETGSGDELRAAGDRRCGSEEQGGDDEGGPAVTPFSVWRGRGGSDGHLIPQMSRYGAFSTPVAFDDH